jgi:hypothetical protein
MPVAKFIFRLEPGKIIYSATTLSKKKNRALIIISANAWKVGWVEERNPTNTKCWVSLRSTQPTRWSK